MSSEKASGSGFNFDTYLTTLPQEHPLQVFDTWFKEVHQKCVNYRRNGIDIAGEVNKIFGKVNDERSMLLIAWIIHKIPLKRDIQGVQPELWSVERDLEGSHIINDKHELFEHITLEDLIQLIEDRIPYDFRRIRE